MKIIKCLAIVFAMVCILCYPVPLSAAAQGTDGTELEVMQPQNLEVQLGEGWAGVEFELKTDAGKYPGVIVVGEDGALRLEIGGSENYMLSCLNSSVEIPAPSENDNTETTADTEALGITPTEEVVETADPTNDNEAEENSHDENEQRTVSGIPVTHLALFGGGMIVAIGALVSIHFYQKRSRNANFTEDEDDEI